MRRTATIIKKSNDGKRCVAVDDELESHLEEFFKENPKVRKKFAHIMGLLLMGKRVPDVYDKEEIDKDSKGVRAMKLLKGSQNLPTAGRRTDLLPGGIPRGQDIRDHRQ